eukprot:m51a1_g5180 hypothetical protein (252) ;mRNA; r:160606-161594
MDCDSALSCPRALGPALTISSTKVYLSAPFTVTVVVKRQWMGECGLTASDIWSSCIGATLHLDGAPSRAPLEPCDRCCRGKHNNIAIGASDKHRKATGTDDELVFVFDRCRSFCNSSRLHLGGRVVLVIDMRNASGEAVARLESEPFTLCSKSARHAALASKKAEEEARKANGAEHDHHDRHDHHDHHDREAGSNSTPANAATNSPGSRTSSQPIEATDARRTMEELRSLEGQYYTRLAQIIALKELLQNF